MLELLKIQGLGPKTVNLIWLNFQVSDVAGVEQLAREGKLRGLPRMSEKTEQKILKAIETYRGISGRFHLDEADRTAAKLMEHIGPMPGVETMTPAGSLRRGRETVGDLDLLITGRCCATGGTRRADRAHFAVSRHCRRAGARRKQGQLQTSQRHANRRAHPSAGLLRRRLAILHRLQGAQRGPAPARAEAGFTLNEYGLFTLEGNELAASATEEEIYGKLGLDWIPPELRGKLR